MSSPFAPTKPIERSPFRVRLIRVGFAAAIVGALTGWSGGLYCAFNQYTPGFVVCFVVAFPCIAYSALIVLSAYAYYFDYSLLGRFVPAPPPPKWMPVARVYSAVKIGEQFHATYPLLRCDVGPGGVRLRLLPFSEWPAVFIPATRIVSISNDWWGSGVIEHTSQEIRSPIRVSRHVVSEMYRCMPELALVRS